MILGPQLERPEFLCSHPTALPSGLLPQTRHDNWPRNRGKAQVWRCLTGPEAGVDFFAHDTGNGKVVRESRCKTNENNFADDGPARSTWFGTNTWKVTGTSSETGPSLPSAETRDSKKLAAWLAKPPRHNKAFATTAQQRAVTLAAQDETASVPVAVRSKSLDSRKCCRRNSTALPGLARPAPPEPSNDAGSNYACVFSKTDRCTTKNVLCRTASVLQQQWEERRA